MSSFVVDIGGDATGLERATKASEKALATVTDSAKRSAIARKQAEADAASAAEQAARAQLAAGKVTEDQYRQVREAAIQANGALRETAAEAVRGQKEIERAAKSRTDQIKKSSEDERKAHKEQGEALGGLGKAAAGLFTTEKMIGFFRALNEEMSKAANNFEQLLDKQSQLVDAIGKGENATSIAGRRAGLNNRQILSLLNDVTAARPNEDRTAIMAEIADVLNAARKTGVAGAGAKAYDALRSLGGFSGGATGLSDLIRSSGSDFAGLSSDDVISGAKAFANNPELSQKFSENVKVARDLEQKAKDTREQALSDAQKRLDETDKEFIDLKKEMGNEETSIARATNAKVQQQRNKDMDALGRAQSAANRQTTPATISDVLRSTIAGTSQLDLSSPLTSAGMAANDNATRVRDRQERSLASIVDQQTASILQDQAERLIRARANASGRQSAIAGALDTALSGFGTQSDTERALRIGELSGIQIEDSRPVRVIIQQDNTTASPLSPLNR